MKNKADLNSIYRMDLLKSRKMVDTLFYSGEILELVAHNSIVKYPTNKATCINK